MNTLSEVKKTLTDNVNIEAKVMNFTYGSMSYYAFKNPKWGAACNVVFAKTVTDLEGRFLLLSEFKNKFCNEKWSLSEAYHLLLKDESYITTNLTKDEIGFVKTAMFREYSMQKDFV